MKFLFRLTLIFTLTAFDVSATDVVIKSTTNRNDVEVGDYWIGEDFAEGFKQNGKQTEIDYRGEYFREHKPEPQINVYMRGYTKFYPPFGKGCNVLYVYYPMAYNKHSKEKLLKENINRRATMPENASLDDDWQNYDVIAVASKTYAEELQNFGIEAHYVPQFTNPDKFSPTPDDTHKTDILFVGSNWHNRTSLLYALESGFEVAVYGFNWQGIVPENMYRAPYIPNHILPSYYASAKIVLNDHRPDMKKYGFINNRIYDATAAGALVVSDYMPEIEAIYGDSVPMYQTKEELKEILAYYLDHEKERLEKAQKARQITLQHFTNKIIAQQIAEVCKNAQNH
jgi:spore maturation protein CgeB